MSFLSKEKIAISRLINLGIILIAEIKELKQIEAGIRVFNSETIPPIHDWYFSFINIERLQSDLNLVSRDLRFKKLSVTLKILPISQCFSSYHLELEVDC